MLRRTVFALLTAVALSAGRAEAVTIRDLIELSKAGLSDPVLLALIEVDRSVFSIDTATLKQLKEAGVSDQVIVALIRSGRQPRPEPVAAPAPEPLPREREPEVIVIDHRDPAGPGPGACARGLSDRVSRLRARPITTRLRHARHAAHRRDHVSDGRRPRAGARPGAAQLREGRAGVLGIRRQAASRIVGAATYGGLPLKDLEIWEFGNVEK